MRQPKYIKNYFTSDMITAFQSYLTCESHPIETKLEVCFQILNINSQKFYTIPFKADRTDFLNYKYMLTNFELFPDKYDAQYKINLLPLRKLFKEAKFIVNTYLQSNQQGDKYSKFAKGLSTLFQRSGDFELPTGSLQASVIQIGEKTGGIEPGFIAAHYQDLIAFLYCYFENNETLIEECIIEFQGNIETMRESFGKNIPGFLPKYMYKLDYKTVETEVREPGKTAVFLTTEDVKRTSNVMKFYEFWPLFGEYVVATLYVYGKNSKAESICKEAVLETLSNDFASIFMPVQTQKLFKSTYKNGDLKLMPYALWVKGGSDFGSKSAPLVGGGDDCNNYKARTVILPQDGICYLSCPGLLNTARYLFPLLFTGDYDKVGSKGQNLMEVALTPDFLSGKRRSQIVGIDFGHTLREKNRLIDSNLQIDGRFLQPFRSPFKNFSALSDGSLCEKMEGLFILARLKGEFIDDSIVKSYGDEFYNYYNQIESGAGNVLCENYIDAMQELQKTDNVNREVYDYVIKNIKEFQTLMNQDLDRFINKFKLYLSYNAKLVDLIDNLTKFSAAVTHNATTLRSNNGQLGLKHLCIKPEYTKTWEVNYDPSSASYTLFCAFGYNSQLSLGHAFLKWKDPNFHLQFSETGIHFKFREKNLPELAALFNEAHIIQEFHAKDYAAIMHAQNEIRLQDRITAPWFAEHHLAMELRQHPSNEGSYQLSIQVEGGKADEHPLKAFFEKEFSLDLNNQPNYFSFLKEQLIDVLEKFERIQNNYQKKLQTILMEKNLLLKKQKEEKIQKVIAQREQEQAIREREAVIFTIDEIIRKEKERRHEEYRAQNAMEPQLSVMEEREDKKLAVFEPMAELQNTEQDLLTVLDGEAFVLDDFTSGIPMDLANFNFSASLLKRYYQTIREIETTTHETNLSESVYSLWQNIGNLVQSAADTYNYYSNPNSSRAIIFYLQCYLKSSDPTLTLIDELIQHLVNRKNYIYAKPVIFNQEEANLLDWVLLCGQKAKLAMLGAEEFDYKNMGP